MLSLSGDAAFQGSPCFLRSTWLCNLVLQSLLVSKKKKKKKPVAPARMLVAEAGLWKGRRRKRSRWAAGCGPARWRQRGEATSLGAVASLARDLELLL